LQPMNTAKLREFCVGRFVRLCEEGVVIMVMMHSSLWLRFKMIGHREAHSIEVKCLFLLTQASKVPNTNLDQVGSPREHRPSCW
jgi:hypothetical protein